MSCFNKYMCLHLVTGLLLVAGCDDAADATPQDRAQAIVAEDASEDASPEKMAMEQVEQVDAPADWRTWVDSEVVRLQSQAPELYNYVRTMEPVETRAGTLRFSVEEKRDPRMLPLLIDRLTHENNSSAVRQALALALTQTGADYSAAAVDLIGQESDPQVRVVLVQSLRRQAGPQALAGLRAALADTNPEVRLQAVFTAGSRPDGSTLAAELLTALDDRDGSVRLEATRTLGALKVEAAKPVLTNLLASPSPDQRLHALRALDRIDPVYTAKLGKLADLATDADPRVVRAVAKLRD
ncbi:MAG: HEAT repeat domain-containing protein [Nannocystaceae bacterium]